MADFAMLCVQQVSLHPINSSVYSLCIQFQEAEKCHPSISKPGGALHEQPVPYRAAARFHDKMAETLVWDL